MGNGVVHVGAHRGEEVDSYIAEGRSPIICFEPLPFHFDFGPDVKCIPAALGEISGTATIRIPYHFHAPEELNTQSASLFDISSDNARSVGWMPTPVTMQKVHVLRFDEWAHHSGFTDRSCSLLVIDVQGMELQAIKGFGLYLDGFSEIVVECSEPALYEGGADASEVVAFLESQGFTRRSAILQHGDIRFTKGRKE